MGNALKRKKRLQQRDRSKKVLAMKKEAKRKELVAMIATWDDEVLKTPASEVEDFQSNLDVANKLKEVLDATENGVGIAANQIKVLQRVFITRPDFPDSKKTFTFINPKITSYGNKKEKAREGCLSYPEYYCDVERSETITIEYTDENGKEQSKSFSGWHARVIQHEYDHISGRCYIYDYWKSLNKKEGNISTL